MKRNDVVMSMLTMRRGQRHDQWRATRFRWIHLSYPKPNESMAQSFNMPGKGRVLHVKANHITNKIHLQRGIVAAWYLTTLREKHQQELPVLFKFAACDGDDLVAETVAQKRNIFCTRKCARMMCRCGWNEFSQNKRFLV